MSAECQNCGWDLDANSVCQICTLWAKVERLQKELAAFKRGLPGWIYSPKGDCIYYIPDALDRGDEF